MSKRTEDTDFVSLPFESALPIVSAFERLGGPEIEEIVVTDTIPLAPEAPDKIKVLSVADILARSIRSIFTDGSVSELFAGENQLF